MSEPTPEPDPAVAVVRAARASGTFAIRDLSVSGARLVGQLELFEGERVQISLALPSAVDVAADVVHIDRQRNVIDVTFRDVSPEARAAIEGAIADTLAPVRTGSQPLVLIVHPLLDVSNALERDLARVGMAARVVATLQEIDAVLEGERPVGVIIAGSFGEAAGPVLQRFEETFGECRRVLLFGETIERLAHPAAGRVDAVLRTPWRFKGLARALEVPAKDVVTTYDQLVALNVAIGTKDPK